MKPADYTKKDPRPYAVKTGDTLRLNEYHISFVDWDNPPTVTSAHCQFKDSGGLD